MILDSQSITVNQIINPSPDQDRQIDDPRGLPFFFLIPAIQQQQKYNPNPTTPRTVSFFSLFHYSKRFYHAHWLISTSTSYLGFFFGGGLGIFFFFWTTLFFFFLILRSILYLILILVTLGSSSPRPLLFCSSIH